MSAKELGQKSVLSAPAEARRGQTAVVQSTATDMIGGATTSQDWRPARLDRSLFGILQLNWEIVAWVTLLIVGAVLRFVNVGVRAMSHDESLHAVYAYYLYDTGKYEHNPMMHGPLLFHMNAVIYFLFGDNDTTARLAPVLYGIAVVWMMWLFRRYIGRIGALMAAIMLTISPSLLFHSRYIRNDIYIALFILIWTYGAFRYLETRHPRYLMMMAMGMAWGFITKEVHYMNGAIMGAFFAGLTIWQIIGHKLWRAVAPVAFGGGIWYWLHIMARDLANQAATAGDGAAALLAQSDRTELFGLIGLGIGLIIALVLTYLALKPGDWQRLRHNASMDLVVLMATLVMPFISPFILSLVFRWDLKAKFDNVNGWTTGEMTVTTILVLCLFALSIALGYFWFGMAPKANAENSDKASSKENPATEPAALISFGFRGWAIIMGTFWLIQIIFFTTFLTNIRNGLATGIVGSLGYWLAQQEVARGGQPWYYYLLLGGLYEFLPWLLSTLGIAVIAYRLYRHPQWDPVTTGDLPQTIQTERLAQLDATASANHQRQVRVYFAVFGIWWVIGTWLAYTVAGEKMPWLMVHIALTMCVVGGWWFGRLLQRIDWPRARATHAVWLIGVTPALLFALLALFGASPSTDRSLSTIAEATQRVLALVITVGLGYLIWRWGEAIRWPSALRLLFVGLTTLLLVLTIRFSYMLNYVNFDMATEYLVYAHASPDVKRALNEIDSISERTVGGRNIVVAYDNDSSWPLSWYMRLYPNNKFYGSAPSADNMTAPVILVSTENYEKVHPYVTRDYVKRTYRLVWWPDMDYFNLTWARVWNAITDPQQRERIFQIAFYRRYRDTNDYSKFRDLAQWPHRHEFEMWVRRDLATQIWDLGVAPIVDTGDSVDTVARDKEIDLTALATYNGVYGERALFNPREVAVAPGGNRVIADSGNNRVVVLDRDGNLVTTFGSACRLNEGEAGGCTDPDGAGPLTLGDGQFNEPWGIAVDQAGQIYVSDTWNGRIQVFDAAGRFLRKWGIFNTTNGELGDANALFGPRGIAIDLEGNLLVADTGNKRIIRFTADGQLLQQIGGGGVVGGRFEEPVGVAVSPQDGSVYVADSWNRRIQKLTPTLEFVAEWPAPGWESQEIYNKPYLAVGANGDLYATDPQLYRVVVYGADGQIKASFGTFGTAANNFDFPTGIALDPETNVVLVTDANNNRVQAFQPVP